MDGPQIYYDFLYTTFDSIYNFFYPQPTSSSEIKEEYVILGPTNPQDIVCVTIIGKNKQTNQLEEILSTECHRTQFREIVMKWNNEILLLAHEKYPEYSNFKLEVKCHNQE